MNKKNGLIKMTFLAMMVAIGVVISPILRVEGMCPMAHLINIVCAVMMGPWYSLLCATLIGIIRMMFMGIPPLALTGAVFGAFLSGVLYRLSGGRMIFAVVGEVIGTGIIGAMVSYPVMTFIVGREGLSLMFYVPSFICGTLIGGSVAFIFLKYLNKGKMLTKMQQRLFCTGETLRFTNGCSRHRLPRYYCLSGCAGRFKKYFPSGWNDGKGDSGCGIDSCGSDSDCLLCHPVE